MKKPIHEHSFWHGFLRSYVDIYLYSFYNRITVVGKNNIPENKPVIIAINHQNALMDALTVLCVLKSQPVFMARADIFKNRLAAKILRSFKILPIFRIRDGIKSLQNNDAVFEEAVGVLLNKKRLAILPEGNHFGQRRLRVLKKGIARIAFQAEERSNFELDIQVVPVGLDYSNYINFGSDLLVHFGQPFSVNQFKDIYLENPQKAMNAFMEELRNRMLPQMLHINDEEHYESIQYLKDIYINHLLYRKGLDTRHTKVRDKSQEISDTLIAFKEENPEKFETMEARGKQVLNDLKTLNLRFWVPAKGYFPIVWTLINTLLQLVLFPLFAVGFIFNFPPFYLPVLAAHKIKDPQFVSSIRFAVSIITFTLFYLGYFIALLLLIQPFYYALLAFLGIYLLGLFSYEYYVWFKKTYARWRAFIYKRKNNPVWKRLTENWDILVGQISNLVK
jgi:1-acyl-sn-glycerol-3-phosphate acyltransferase